MLISLCVDGASTIKATEWRCLHRARSRVQLNHHIWQDVSASASRALREASNSAGQKTVALTYAPPC